MSSVYHGGVCWCWDTPVCYRHRRTARCHLQFSSSSVHCTLKCRTDCHLTAKRSIINQGTGGSYHQWLALLHIMHTLATMGSLLQFASHPRRVLIRRQPCHFFFACVHCLIKLQKR
jgi:hypothetical protein